MKIELGKTYQTSDERFYIYIFAVNLRFRPAPYLGEMRKVGSLFALDNYTFIQYTEDGHFEGKIDSILNLVKEYTNADSSK